MQTSDMPTCEKTGASERQLFTAVGNKSVERNHIAWTYCMFIDSHLNKWHWYMFDAPFVRHVQVRLLLLACEFHPY